MICITVSLHPNKEQPQSYKNKKYLKFNLSFRLRGEREGKEERGKEERTVKYLATRHHKTTLFELNVELWFFV